ncbi:META domain-containing protein [Lacihabitans sp. CCS-44]|uniref:META domain-containing protein n=1 Tax=Lacihabitans sp. CCS-44 TaxID=2487331 RepID=UPI0020CEDF1C|nr:META domain-containing protein [Lacihabitans sp. CCS-44]MCP9753848.1 META domain-containing protein [Lacihabitans sp. CCS-44]
MRYFLLILFLMLNACKSGDAISPDDSYTIGLASRSSIHSKWKLVSFENNQKINYEVVLEFKAERNEKGRQILSGKSSINFYQADFIIENSKLVISNLSKTEIAGNASAEAFEAEYLKRLSETTNFNISSETLTLSTAKQQMTFKLNN